MTYAVLVFALAAFCFINFHQATNDSPNYGTFFVTRDAFADPGHGSDETRNVIDESFHKCSNEKSCSNVAENVNTNKYKMIEVGQELPLDKQDTRVWNREKREKTLRIEVLSAGFEDPGGKNSIIKVNGIDHASNISRGLNFVVLSGKSGEVISTDVFQVRLTNEAKRMTEYINAIESGNIVLISARGEVAYGMTTEAEQAIHALGATTRLTWKNGVDDVRFRGSFALVTTKGTNKKPWFAEKAADRNKGPSRIEVRIPIRWY